MTDAPLPLRVDPDFRRYWLARQVSITGSLTTAVALPVLVYRISHSPTLTALTTVMEALPYLVFGLFAGALSDRWNRRKVMVNADLVNAFVLASVPIAWWLDLLTVPHVIAVGFVSQGVFAFFDGANFGALPTLVGRSRVGEANAAIWGFGGVLDLVVPLSVGASLAVIHPADLLVLDALTFLVSAALVRQIRRPLSLPRDDSPPFRPMVIVGEVVEGLRWLWRHDGVRGNTIIGTLQSAAGAGFMAMSVPWADRILHIGTSGWRFGLVFAVWGIGGILAAVLTPRLLRRMSTLRIVLLAIPLSAFIGIATVFAPHWAAAAALLAVWGIFYQLVIVNSISYRMQVVPDRLQGRVNTAGRVMSWGLGWSAGAGVAGVLEPVIGLRGTMLALVSLCAVAAVYAWISPLRTHVDDPVAVD